MAGRAGAVAISVEGLDELRRDLKQAGDRATSTELRKKLKDAAEIVASDARSEVPVVSGNARSTVKAGATATSAYVTGGKKENPYYGWLDFGTRSPNQQIGPWRNSGTGPKGGRFIYPAIAANSALLVDKVTDAIDTALKKENL
jgi:HK97 gp10 family phage protein